MLGLSGVTALRRLLDPLAFSSLWLAGTAAALAAAASQALAIPPAPRALGLAFCGTLVVYNVDRLRDLERDRLTAPARSAFVEAHGGLLAALCVLAGLVCLVLAWPPRAAVLLLLAPILAAGLAHRRLKRFGFAKALYLVAAWVGVTVGLPAVLARSPVEPGALASTTGILAASILANAIASNIRDQEAGALRVGLATALATARVVAFLAVLFAVLAPPPIRRLLPIPALTLCALLPFRADERYGLLVVDGALLVGALASLALPD